MCRKYFFFLFFLMSPATNCIDIGSDTSVTLFNNQVPIADSDRIAGFAALNGGFFLDDGATVLFDSFFPVAGNIQMNGATLNLNQDLILQDASSIVSLGTINANFHQIELAPGITAIPVARAEGNCAISAITTAAQPAQANETDWSSDSQYIVVGTNDAGGAATQVRVYKFNGTTLTLQGTGIDLGAAVNSVAWNPTSDLIAAALTNGDLIILDFNRGTGALTIASTTAAGTGSITSVVWHPSGNFIGAGSTIAGLNAGVAAVDGAGTIGAFAVVNPGAAANSVDFNIDGTFFAVGTSTGVAAQLFVYAFDSVAITLTLNASIAVGNQVNAVAWNEIAGTDNLIAVGVNAGTGRVRVYRLNAGTLTLLTQAINATIVNFVSWNPLSGCLAACLNNNSEGSGGEIRIYTLSSNVITETDSESAGASNVIGGRWSPDGNYFASGDSGSLLRTFAFSPTLFAVSCIFSNIRLYLNNNLTIQDCQITFTGNNLISGRTNSLTLLATQTVFSTRISVAANSSILFQNITIQGIKAGSIVPLDSTSTFSFQNCTFIMDSNYTFSQGRFDVLRGFNLEGSDNSFIYTSNQTSRILAEGNMLIDSGVTFSYAPSNNSSALLQLTNINSTLSLNSGTIVTSSAGLRLTTGLLSIDGASFLINGGTSKAQGIFWGDGVNSVNNLQLEWQPAATLQLLNGFLINANV